MKHWDTSSIISWDHPMIGVIQHYIPLGLYPSSAGPLITPPDPKLCLPAPLGPLRTWWPSLLRPQWCQAIFWHSEEPAKLLTLPLKGLTASLPASSLALIHQLLHLGQLLLSCLSHMVLSSTCFDKADDSTASGLNGFVIMWELITWGAHPKSTH